MQMMNDNDLSNFKVQGGLVNGDIEEAKNNPRATDYSSRVIMTDLKNGKQIACYNEKIKNQRLSEFLSWCCKWNTSLQKRHHY